MKKQTKNTRASGAVNKAILEIRRHLDQAQFDEEGYRIHDQTLFEAGQLFAPWLPSKGMDKQKLARLLAKEYARECRWAYDYQADFISFMVNSPEISPDSFRAKWPSFIVDFIEASFPCPSVEGMDQEQIEKALAPAPAACAVPLSKNEINPFRNDKHPIQDYALTIDWRKGPEAIERSLAAWIRENAPDNIPTLRGRNNAIDRFHELAAYRAKRAGLDHAEFGVLVGREGGNAIYSDQPQFLRAARATARRIQRFDSDIRRLIATHRKKNK